MPDARRRSHSVDRKTRSDIYLAVYISLGPQRTIRGVGEMARHAGISVSVKTLEAYSRDYGWIDAVREFDEQVTAQQYQTVFEDALAVDKRHVDLAKTMQALGLKGAQALQRSDDPGLRGSEVSRLISEGIKWERVSLGKATEITHQLSVLYDALGGEVARYYQMALDSALDVALAEVPDALREGLRQRALDAAHGVFGPGVDRMQQEHFRAITSGDVQIVDE